MTLLARRREELKRERTQQEPVEKRRSVAVRPPQPHPSFLHVQAALGNRATTSLLRSAAVLAKQQDDLLAQELSPVVQLAQLLQSKEAAHTSSGFLVPDGTAPAAGQMTRSGFLAALRDAAREAAERGLAGTGHTARGCPWIEHYFHYYQRQSAERIEADLLRYVPAAYGATSAGELLALATVHIQASVGHWAATGELTGVPRGLPGAGLMGALAGSLAAVQAQLGEGRPLESSVRSRMERAFSTRFADVRLHTGAVAARLAHRLRARAFAIGPHIAFRRGEYRPGTPVGDALLAHELAHTVQQRGAGAASTSAISARRGEGEAVAASVGVLARLWSRGRALGGDLPRQVRPRLRTGLALASCRETFSDQELREYLQHLKTTGLWGGLEGDNRARAVVRENHDRPGTFVLEDIHVQRMIEEMLDGPTGGEDEDAILELLQRSKANRLQFLFTAGGITAKRLLCDFSDSQEKKLRAFFEQRFHGGLKALEANDVRAIPDADLAEIPSSVLDRPEDTTLFLTETAEYIKAETGRARDLLKPGDREALKTLNQERVARWLKNVRTAYETVIERLGAKAAEQAPLRRAYIEALDKIREAASTALVASEGLDVMTVDRERTAYAENVTAWIEASPLTSAGLAAQRTFGPPDVEVAHAYEAVLKDYLDQLLEDLPKLKLSQADRDRINARLLAALRRAYLTVDKGASGRVDVRAIRNPEIAKKYRQVTAYLVEESRAPKMQIIDLGVSYELPSPIPDVTSQLKSSDRIGEIDLSRVPPDEHFSVLYGLQVAESTHFLGTSITFQNAIWPFTMPVRRGGVEMRIRYELIFDEKSNVRVERLGEARPREVPPEFSRLGIAEKKAALVQEFGLTALDDRPAFTPPPAPAGGAPGGTPAGAAPPQPRPERKWSSQELDQLKGALDLLPAAERPILKGVTLVRDFKSPTDPEKTAGVFQSSESKILDEPAPPAHPPPHIHYYDLAFASSDFTSTGPPGSTGPGAEETLLHEIGHLRIGQVHIQASAANQAANTQVTDASEAISQAVKEFPLNKPKLDAWNAWIDASKKVSTAISDYTTAVKDFSAKSKEAQKTNKPFPDPATLQPKQAAAEAALQASTEKRKKIDKLGLPSKLRKGAADFEAGLAAQIKAWQQYVAHDRQIPIFATLANRFGFHPFTDYARSGGEGEWFAETYLLYATDPDRLNSMSPKLFLWFEAGMPMDPQWEPPKEEKKEGGK